MHKKTRIKGLKMPAHTKSGPLYDIVEKEGFRSITTFANKIRCQRNTLSQINAGSRPEQVVYGAGGGVTDTAQRISKELGINPEEAYHADLHYHKRLMQPVDCDVFDVIEAVSPPWWGDCLSHAVSAQHDGVNVGHLWRSFLMKPLRCLKRGKIRRAMMAGLRATINQRRHQSTWENEAKKAGVSISTLKYGLKCLCLHYRDYYGYEKGDLSDNVDLFDWLA
jgi:hypothetical protein